MLLQNKTIWTPDNSSLLEYFGRIESGEIIAGQDLYVRLLHLAEDFHNDRYCYNTDAARLRMDFMEHCVRLTKSPFYGKPMILMLWQKAFIEAMYSFKMAEQSRELGFWIDRFQKIILLIARKNTKSETCSGLGTTELFLGNPGSDIVCSSNDDNQSSITYDAINLMRQLIDPNDLDSKRNQRFILNKITNTKIFKLSDRTRNKEGRNIDFAIIDETHEMKNNVIGKSIEQSQSLKNNPKMVNITTEGFVFEGYLDEELKLARASIYEPDPDDLAMERLLAWLYTQDSENEVWDGNRENRLWMKSNPTLGIVKKWSYLEQQVAVAKKSKSDRIFVLSKDFNIKQNSAESWLNLEDYMYPAVYDIEEFRGAYCLGAVDLAETTDLVSAKILLMRPDDPVKYIHTQYFIPQTKLTENNDSTAGARYEEWARDGYITICEGNDVDLDCVADWFYQLFLDYEIRLLHCGYDQKFAKQWISRMNEYGWAKESEELVIILQNAQTLSNAMKLVETDLKHQLVNYNENPVDRWCFKNSGIKVDDKANCMCVKQEAAKKIDGAVTTIILYETYRRYRTEFKTLIRG